MTAGTVTWTNTAGGNWSGSLNWSPNGPPGSNDLAVLAELGNTYAVALDVPANVGGLVLGATNGANTQSLSTAGSELTVDGMAQINSQGILNLDGGQFDGSGVVSGTFSVSSGNWEGSLTVSSNGLLEILAGNDFFDNLVVTNYGTVDWTNGNIVAGAGNVYIYNYGLWNAQTDNSFQGGYGGGTSFFNNFGTFLKSGNTGATLLDTAVVFNNSGTVSVESGTLNVEGPGVNNGGELTTGSNAVLNLYDFTFTNTTTIIGTRTFLAGNAVFGGTIAGTLTWDTGSMVGIMTLATNSVLNLIGAGNVGFQDLIFTNYGTVNWSNVNLVNFSGNDSVYNYGLWDAESDNYFQGGYGGGTSFFNNFGTFLKSGHAGTTLLDSGVMFNNSGTVNVQSGTLQIDTGMNSGGTVNTAGAASLYYDNYTFPSNTTFTGTGAVVLSGNITMNGVITAPNLQLAGGTLNGTSALEGTLSMSGGILQGSMTVDTNSILEILAGNDFFDGMVITNYGTVNWTNGSIVAGTGNASIYNYGLWDAQTDNTFQGGYQGGTSLFDNFGTFLKSGNAGTTVLDSAVLFNNTGTVNVESGTVNIGGPGLNNGGNLITTNNAILNLYDFTFTNTTTIIGLGSYLAGNALFGGTIAGTLTWNAGNLTGTLNLASHSVLNLIGAGNVDLDGLILTNHGMVNWSNVNLVCSSVGASIYNYASWNAESDNYFQGGNAGGSSLFDNIGTFLKFGTAGITTLDARVALNNLGTLNAQSGTISLNTYNLAGGTLNFGISSLTNYGAISLAGAAALTSTVTANLNNGYLPLRGDSFTNLYYGSLSGIFTNAVLPYPDSWITNYTATYFYLQVLEPGPVPVQFYPLLFSDGTVSVYFGTVNGQSYTVQQNSNLATTNWTFYTNIIGDGSLYQLLPPNTDIPQLFFRILEP